MSHWKWRETKLQPSRARSGNQISCCLVALHFLCDILAQITVVYFQGWFGSWQMKILFFTRRAIFTLGVSDSVMTPRFCDWARPTKKSV